MLVLDALAQMVGACSLLGGLWVFVILGYVIYCVWYVDKGKLTYRFRHLTNKAQLRAFHSKVKMSNQEIVDAIRLLEDARSDGQEIKQLKDDIADEYAEMQNTSQQITLLEEIIAELKGNIAKVESFIDELNVHIEQVKSIVNQLQGYIADFRNALRVLDVHIESSSLEQGIVTNMRTLQSSIQRVLSQVGATAEGEGLGDLTKVLHKGNAFIAWANQQLDALIISQDMDQAA